MDDARQRGRRGLFRRRPFPEPENVEESAPPSLPQQPEANEADGPPPPVEAATSGDSGRDADRTNGEQQGAPVTADFDAVGDPADPAPGSDSPAVPATHDGGGPGDWHAPPEPSEIPPRGEALTPVQPAESDDVVDAAPDAAPDAADDPVGVPRSAEAPVRPLDLPCVLAIANQKGGVGKTTTAVNLGAALAELDFRVLVLDLDPQGNATTGLGINARNVGGSVYDVLMNDVPVEDCVEPTSLRNLFVVPATIDLAGAEIELVPAMSRELKLRRAVDDVRADYDFVLIDCPPSLGLLTVNGLAAADGVLVPIQCEYYALEGLGQLLRNVSLVRSNLNPRLDVRGIVLTMYDARTKLADQVAMEVRSHFGSKVYRTIVPRTVRISEAPSFGQPVIVFDSTSRGAIAYRELAKEVSRGASRRSG